MILTSMTYPLESSRFSRKDQNNTKNEYDSIGSEKKCGKDETSPTGFTPGCTRKSCNILKQNDTQNYFFRKIKSVTRI